MSERIRIPNTIEAKGALAAIEGLVVAREWERCATVVAFTHDGDGDGRYSVREFAALGIVGLRTVTSVEACRTAWREHGTVDPKPGRTVVLPTVAYPFGQATRNNVSDEDAIRAQALEDGTGPSKAVNIAANTKAMAAAIKASPKVAAAAARALGYRAGPETMTPEERIEVARNELRQHPHEVLEDDEARISAEDASIEIRAGQAPRMHPHYVEHQMDRVEQNVARALGLDVPTQHLRAATSELFAALLARDVHGVDDEADWKVALVEVEKALERVKSDSAQIVWTEDDRRQAADLGIDL